MSNNTLTYKGYVAKVEFDRERGLLYGTVQGHICRRIGKTRVSSRICPCVRT